MHSRQFKSQALQFPSDLKNFGGQLQLPQHP